MAACDTGYAELPDNMSQAEALRKYSAHKKWVDRYIEKFTKLFPMLEKTYDRRTDKKIEEMVTKAENEVAVLSQITEFLKQMKFNKVEEHEQEVEILETRMVQLWDKYNDSCHKRATQAGRAGAAAPAAAPAAGGNTPTLKLVAELKPETLSHDASAGNMRIWIRKFEAYYHASAMHLARNAVQHAYFLNCLDSELSLRMDSLIQVQTPVLGQLSCMSLLQSVFQQKYPLMLRRKQFFQMQQQPGQDERTFLESLKSAANEADIEGMDVQDALCLTLVSGLRDLRLKEKLSEIETPTLHAFSVLVDAHMHSRATAGEAAAVGNKSSPYQQGKKNPNKRGGNNNNNNQRPGISDAEKKRREIMKGKCFRCGKSDHFANVCTVPKDVKCHKCNNTGHTQAACVKSQGQARNTEENPSLAIEYDQSPGYAQNADYAQASLAVAQYTGFPNHSRPTPPVLL